MAKLTKSTLKSIVKECLVEILSEGIGSSEDLQESSRKTRQRNELLRKAEEKRLKEHREKFEVKVDNTINELTDDPVMQSIFADTAKTTLQEQANHDRSPATATGDHAGSGIDLGEIFSGASANWSELAFSEKKKM